jgi:8-oxo-dGTP diphosphatase
MKIVDVAVAVFLKPNGAFLLSSRPVGKPYAGYWEFPGGKIEPGESVRDALTRELIEELNVVIDDSSPWFSFVMHYEHASVRLHTWRVTRWHDADARGMHGREGQAFAWQASVPTLTVSPTLPGCVPIFRALSLPTRMLVTNASELGVETYLQHLRAFSSINARNSASSNEFVHPFIVQVREKTMSAEPLRAFAHEVIAIAHEANALVLINTDTDLAASLGADGVHLSAAALAACKQRPAFEWVGASTHARADITRAVELGCDFAVLGSVNATPSHPNQAPLGWAQFTALAREAPIPVFAIGGMLPTTLGGAQQSGAHGIAMQRGAF